MNVINLKIYNIYAAGGNNFKLKDMESIYYCVVTKFIYNDITLTFHRLKVDKFKKL